MPPEALKFLEDVRLAVERITDYGQIIAFRNILIHGYDVVDHSIVWSIVEDKLEALHTEVRALLDEAADR